MEVLDGDSIEYYLQKFARNIVLVQSNLNYGTPMRVTSINVVKRATSSKGLIDIVLILRM